MLGALLSGQGTDYAPTGLTSALSHAIGARFHADNGITNATFSEIAGPEDLLHRAVRFSNKVNFLYSLLVFQHIPDFQMIEGYLHVIAILLRSDGIAYVQFDTRPKNVAYQIKSSLPDLLLPRFWRKGIRRVRRLPEEIHLAVRRAGLEVVGELGPFTAYHRYILKRSVSHSTCV